MAAGSSSSLTFNILGNDVSGSKALAGVAGSAAKSSKSISSSFGSILGALKQQASPALAPILEVTSSFEGLSDSLKSNLKSVSGTLTGVGVGLVGAGGVLTSVGDQEKQANAQLADAIDNTGSSYDDFEGKIENVVKSQEKYGHTATQTEDALQTLTNATHDPQKALNSMAEVADLAASKHISLNDAATMVAKGLNSKSKLYAQYGIQIGKNADGTADYTDANKKLAQILSGQAAAASSGFNGKLRGLAATVEDQVGTFGNKYGPTILKVGAAMGVAGSAIDGAKKIMGLFSKGAEAAAVAEETLTAAQEANTVATEAETVAQGELDVAMDANPIGILIVAIAALVAAVVLIATKTTWFQTIFRDAFGAIKAVALAVVGWFTGPFLQFFTVTIPGAFQKMLGFLVRVWDTVWSFLKTWGPVALAVLVPFIGIPLLIFQHFSAIAGFMSRAWSAAYNAVRGWIGTIISLVLSIPSRIIGLNKDLLTAGLHLMQNFWQGLRNGVGDVGGFVADIGKALARGINSILHLPIHIPKINTHLPGIGTIGGETLIPAIPLAMSGTVLPRPGGTLTRLAEAGRAESVVDTGLLNGMLAKAQAGAGVLEVTINVPGAVTPATAAAVGRELGTYLTAHVKQGGQIPGLVTSR